MAKKVDINELTSIFRRIFEEPNLILNNSMNASDVEKWDSLNYMRLLSAIEKEYDFKFKLQDLIEMKNIENIISKINTRLDNI